MSDLRCLPESYEMKHTIIQVDAISEPTLKQEFDLPNEILEKIFIYATNAKLAYLNRKLYQISKSPLTRSRWLISKYGVSNSMACCWKWRFMRVYFPDLNPDLLINDEYMSQTRSMKKFGEIMRQKFKMRKRCNCRGLLGENLSHEEIQSQNTPNTASSWTRWIQVYYNELIRHGGNFTNQVVQFLYSADDSPDSKFTKCPLERKQMLILAALIDLGANVRSGGDMSLRQAAKWGHLNLVEMLLICGADPNASIARGYRAIRATNHRLQQFSSGLFTWPWERIGGGAPVLGNTTQSPVNLTNPLTPPPAPPGIEQPQANNNNQNIAINNNNNQNVNNNNTRRQKKKENYETILLFQAVRAKNIPLLELLLQPRLIPAARQSLLLNSATLPQPIAQTSELNSPTNSHSTPSNDQNTIPITPNFYLVSRVSYHTLQKCLEEAFSEAGSIFPKRRETGLNICRLLINTGKARPNPRLVQKLLIRASCWRVTLGVRRRFEDLLVLAIESMSRDKLEMCKAYIMRSICEIGSKKSAGALVKRVGRDVVNVWDGIPLYFGVAGANLQVVEYLLSEECRVDTSTFNWKRILTVTFMIFTETFALTVCSLVIILWLMGVIKILIAYIMGTTITFSQPKTNSLRFTIWDQTALTVTAVLSITFLYRLAPLNEMIVSFCKKEGTSEKK
ncbi:hypothetical protein HK098_002348 [Nowakowskiella sp. JEL0407]|nr:hypothetical protein HK098_002348 [Nowakowskiella sp. JEL0407]